MDIKEGENVLSSFSDLSQSFPLLSIMLQLIKVKSERRDELTVRSLKGSGRPKVRLGSVVLQNQRFGSVR